MSEHTMTALAFLTVLFVVSIVTAVAVLAVLCVRDVAQRRDEIRQNCPVIGRFRYLFERLGSVFRQYFFALNHQGPPANRAERNWV